MYTGSRYGSMEGHLSVLASQSDLEELKRYLSSLTNSGFRQASKLLSDKVLVKLRGEGFWRVFSCLSLYNPKAFLGTCLKAALAVYANRGLKFEGECLERYSEYIVSHGMDIDCGKFLKSVLGLLREEKEFENLWKMFAVNPPQKRIEYLVRCNTPISYFMIFKECKHLQDDHDYLRKLCHALTKKGDSLSFNLASILRVYFGVEGVNALFSLKIEPYKLNYIDKSFENFEKVMTSL